MRLDGAAARRAVVAPVVEPQPFGVPAEVRQFGQHGRVDGVGAGTAQHRHGVGVQRAHTAAQPLRQHLLQFGEGPYRGLADALDALPGGGAQPDGDGDGLLVVQQQRRQFGTGTQPVAAAGARAGVDGVAEFAQPVHVPPQRPGADAQPAGQIGAGPLTVGLEQGQQAQQACRGLQHGASLPGLADSSGPEGARVRTGDPPAGPGRSPHATDTIDFRPPASFADFRICRPVHATVHGSPSPVNKPPYKGT
ncbi:hypothetical protein GCM10010280_53090 [Streptomyces pilosus]|uniref:Uncharacterized protein n=1 Tax=Streptomyces pilosus TaxID=28893 RepID=A0A918F3V8_9ACTN|nr:hypothetical protein GCM10010280_53090 [Streptomyces pilosus]